MKCLSDDAIENNIIEVVQYLLKYAVQDDVRNDSLSKYIIIFGCIKLKIFVGNVKADRVSKILRSLGMIDSELDKQGVEISRADRVVNHSFDEQLNQYRSYSQGA